MTVPPTGTKLSKFWAGSSGCLTGDTRGIVREDFATLGGAESSSMV